MVREIADLERNKDGHEPDYQRPTGCFVTMHYVAFIHGFYLLYGIFSEG